MDSYNFHFERMSNVDLQPLSLPVSRLSPAKSNSSIVEQLSHHQHGKGDSAYSSFSGGSTAPDYPSPFPEDMQSSTFCHYSDNKYVKSIYQPTQVLQSDSKTMDQLYRSVEAISQQYRNNTNSTVNPPRYNDDNLSQPNSTNLLKPAVLLGTASQSAYPAIRPPPVPARQDSFIATKNLENSRGFQYNTEINSQQLQPQQQTGFINRVNPQPHTLNASRIETANPTKSNLIFNSDPVYSVWKGPQQPQQQTRQPSTYKPHLKPRDQSRVSMNPEYLSIADNKVAAEQQKSANTLSRSPPRGTRQTEHLTNKQLSTGSECIRDNQNKTSNSSHFESQRKRSNSVNDWLGSEPTRSTSPWNARQSFINSSIQHKGQFYFVTGVCKQPDSSMRTHSLSVCGSESCAEISTLLETHRLSEKERCYSTMDELFQPLQDSSRSSSCTITDERENYTSLSLEDDLISKDQENYQPPLRLTQSSPSFNTFEESENREIGRHTANNPIFYCGPDRNSSAHTPTQMMEVTSLINNEQNNIHKKEDFTKRGKRQPLGDVACDRINKETTPLLYHLTGANRAPLKPRKEPGQENGTINDARMPPDEMKRNNRGEVACNTLDDSFKKYYKEKLKDAQSKVLRETSFKRRDLQLSWPHRVRQNPEPRYSAIHSVFSSLDSEFSIDTLIPAVTPEETESLKEDVNEYEEKTSHKMVKEMGRSANEAQPQVVRIRGRKRLTAEQKKMCYSEPEKLNQLGSGPDQLMCRSFSNGSETMLAGESEGDEQLQNEAQGLVAARRKVFETRGRTLSASNVSKTNLKHLQHKALVEYMERKTGQKVAEPQQPAPQTPLPPRQRHSLGEKPFDWGPRPLSGNMESKLIKKKLHRPHSAGRILDSSTSSMRYAQFFSALSCSGQFAGQQNQTRRRESQGPAQVKSASAETLLDQPEPPSFLRNRSTSTPHTFEPHAYKEDPLPVNAMETQSTSKRTTEEPAITSVPEGQQPVRVIGLRGKSMEELGTSKVAKISALSRSSEQLDQLWRYSTEPGHTDREKKRDLFSDEVGEAKKLDKIRKNQYETHRMAKETEMATQNNPQGQTQNQTLKKSCEPEADTTAEKANLSRSTSPISSSSSRVRSQSALPESDDLKSNRQPSGTSSNPPSPRVLQVSEREIMSSLMPTKPSCENRPSSRVQTYSVPELGNEQSVDEPSEDNQPPDLTNQVSLSCGITTDRSLWILPPNEELKEEVQSSPATVFFESTNSVSSNQTRENTASPRLSTSDTDISQHVGNRKLSETENEKVGETVVLEERGTPEGETDSMRTPVERPLWGELVKTIVKADQSLARVLYPLANRKTALMLMEQLLSEDTLLMEEHYKKKQEQKSSAESSEVNEGSEPMPQSASDSLKSEGTDLQSKADITEKKHLLVSYINERLHSLEETRSALQLDMDENAARGDALVVLVRERCQPVELERYNLFIGDLDRVVSLLLCLSARLARVQNALSTVDEDTDAEEKQSLDSRHRLLCKQREDAKDLKDNLDRRENLVSTFLSRQLSAEQLQDYRRFVQTKASLLIQQKDLEEKQRLAEEQLEALSNSLKL